MAGDEAEVPPLPPPDPSYHAADLTKAMEHMRPYVSVSTSNGASSDQTDLANPAERGLVYGVPESVIEPMRKPAQVQRSAANPEKRTDPFQFGSRFLEEGDDIFEFNAWDHVEINEEFKAFAEEQYERQREAPVSDFDKTRFNNNPEKWWNKFYSNNNANFFKNRKWLFQEFPSLAAATAATSPPVTVLEIGAGAGNTAFPILAQNANPGLRIHACDYSRTAVQLIRNSEEYTAAANGPGYIQADVWDVASIPKDPEEQPEPGHLPPGLGPASVDIVILIFIFSALSPGQWTQALQNIWTLLKPGGEILFRDYGRGDLAQVRFKKGRWLDENFYVRGDGTRVYFFEKEELEQIFSGNKTVAGAGTQPAAREHNDKGELEDGDKREDKGEYPEIKESTERPRFEILNLGVDRRMLVNRKRKLKMYRCWMQGRFKKPLLDT